MTFNAQSMIPPLLYLVQSPEYPPCIQSVVVRGLTSLVYGRVTRVHVIVSSHANSYDIPGCAHCPEYPLCIQSVVVRGLTSLGYSRVDMVSSHPIQDAHTVHNTLPVYNMW